MKLDLFQQLVLYALTCILRDSFPHVNAFIMKCVSNGEIIGNVKEGIHAEADYLRSLTREEK